MSRSKVLGSYIRGGGQEYLVQQKVGQGGYAVVYRVTCTQDEKDYVVKKINLEFLSEKESKLAYQEAQKLFMLRSKYIINIHSFFQHDLILYIVMDFADVAELNRGKLFGEFLGLVLELDLVFIHGF